MIRICLRTVDLPLSPAPAVLSESCYNVKYSLMCLPSSRSFTSRSAFFLSTRRFFSMSSLRRDSGSAGFLPKHIIAGAMYRRAGGWWWCGSCEGAEGSRDALAAHYWHAALNWQSQRVSTSSAVSVSVRQTRRANQRRRRCQLEGGGAERTVGWCAERLQLRARGRRWRDRRRTSTGTWEQFTCK